MDIKRETGTAALLWISSMPLWGGTGRPSDGLLSFILLLGFLLFILGIIETARFVRRRIQNLLKDIF